MNTNVLTENETNTPTTTDDFDQAVALIASYFTEKDDDSELLNALVAVRITCTPDSLKRILILISAISDPRFDEYGAADSLAILRDMKITDELDADVEFLLESMRLADIAAFEHAQREYAEVTSPFRIAACRLLTKFGQPSYPQVQEALKNL